MWQKVRDGWILVLVSVALSLFIMESTNHSNSKNSESISEISSMRYDLSQLQTKVADISNEVNESIVNKLGKATAFFTPSSEGFSILDTEYGKFLVRLSKLEKYADGYRATFEISNIYTMYIENIDLNIAWGNKSAKASILDPLRPGAWKTKSIVLSPATEEEIKFIQVSLDTSKATISLQR